MMKRVCYSGDIYIVCIYIPIHLNEWWLPEGEVLRPISTDDGVVHLLEAMFVHWRLILYVTHLLY
jgi:hypothetical protein